MKPIAAAALALSLAAFSACSNKTQKPNESQNTTATHFNQSDAIQQKLQELAGSGATDCGSPKSQQPSEVQPASDCAMKAAQSKQAFYVRYDLPGMTTAIAGDSQGKLYAVQSEANGQLQSTPCPAEIRIAGSGRVTCYPAGSMGGMGTHGDMSMPPATGPNPHDGSAIPSHGEQSRSKKLKP